MKFYPGKLLAALGLYLLTVGVACGGRTYTTPAITSTPSITYAGYCQRTSGQARIRAGDYVMIPGMIGEEPVDMFNLRFVGMTYKGDIRGGDFFIEVAHAKKFISKKTGPNRVHVIAWTEDKKPIESYAIEVLWEGDSAVVRFSPAKCASLRLE